MTQQIVSADDGSGPHSHDTLTFAKTAPLPQTSYEYNMALRDAYRHGREAAQGAAPRHAVFALKQCDQCWAMHESATLTRYCPACGCEDHTVIIDNGESEGAAPEPCDHGMSAHGQHGCEEPGCGCRYPGFSVWRPEQGAAPPYRGINQGTINPDEFPAYKPERAAPRAEGLDVERLREWITENEFTERVGPEPDDRLVDAYDLRRFLVASERAAPRAEGLDGRCFDDSHDPEPIKARINELENEHRTHRPSRVERSVGRAMTASSRNIKWRIVANMPYPASCLHCNVVTTDPDAYFFPTDYDDELIPESALCPINGRHEARTLSDFNISMGTIEGSLPSWAPIIPGEGVKPR